MPVDKQKTTDWLKSWFKKNLSYIKGFVALAFGIALVYRSHFLVINLIVFTVGILFIYYGLIALKLKKITSIIDKLITSLRK